MKKEMIYERLAEYEKNVHIARFKGDKRATKRAARMRVILLRRLAIEILKDANAAPMELAKIGAALCHALDAWKTYGATLDELCNLCNQRELKIPSHEQCYPFSTLISLYGLDDKGGPDVNAPLARAVQAANIHRFITAICTAGKTI